MTAKRETAERTYARIEKAVRKLTGCYFFKNCAGQCPCNEFVRIALKERRRAFREAADLFVGLFQEKFGLTVYEDFKADILSLAKAAGKLDSRSDTNRRKK